MRKAASSIGFSGGAVLVCVAMARISIATIYWRSVSDLPLQAENYHWVGFDGGRLIYLAPNAAQYNIQLDQWSSLPDCPEVPSGAGAQIGSTVYLIGSHTFGAASWQDSVWGFDISTTTWTQGPATWPGFAPARVEAIDGIVYGFSNAEGTTASTTGTAYDDAMSFNPMTGAWSELSPMPIPEFGPSSAVMNGEVLLFGGASWSTTVLEGRTLIYSPVSDSWTQGTSMPAPRLYTSAVEVGGRIFVIGGGIREAPYYVPLVEVYDPLADSWSGETSLPEPRAGGAVAARGCEIFYFGGSNPAGSASASMFIGTVLNQSVPSVSIVAPVSVSMGQEFAASAIVTTGTCTRSMTGSLIYLTQTGSGNVLVDAGGNPAGPMTIPGGGISSIPWTLSGVGAGQVFLTASLTGYDWDGGATIFASAVGMVNIQVPARLDATLYVASGGCVGFPMVVVLEVTNAGEASATALVASAVPAVSGSAGVSLLSSPAPVASLPGAGVAMFSWTYSATSAGSVAISLSVTGFDGNAGWPVSTGLVTSGGIQILEPGMLDVSVNAPVLAPVGSWFQVSLTLTNTGGRPVNAVVGTIAKSPPIQPMAFINGPSFLPVLPSGGSTTFTWTYSVSGWGRVDLSVSASGMDGCHLVAAGKTATVDLGTPAVLALSVLTATPAAVCYGSLVSIRGTVTNTGQVPASVAGLPLVVSGGAISAAAPLGVTSLAGGGSAVVSWSYSMTSGGAISFSGSVAGVDLRSGAAVGAGLSPSNGVVVLPPPILMATLVVSPSGTVVEGQWVNVMLTVTNTGGNSADAVIPGLAMPIGQAQGGVMLGPTPAGPLSIAPSGSQTFVWSVSVAGSGVLTFSGSVSGSWCGSLPVAAGASSSLMVRRGAVLTIDSLILSPGVTRAGTTLYAAMIVRNIGEVGLTLTLEGRPTAGNSLLTSTDVLSLPLVLEPGSSTLFVWTHVSRSICGIGSVIGLVGGLEYTTGKPLGMSRVSNSVSLIGDPVSLSVVADPVKADTRSVVTIIALPRDSCGFGVPGESIAFTVMSGGGWLSGMNAMTDATGMARVSLTLGEFPGANIVRGDVIAASSVSGTVIAEGVNSLGLDLPGSALSSNDLDPWAGEVLVIRIRPRETGAVMVRIFTGSGRLVRTLRTVEGVGQGQWKVAWDGRTEDEVIVARGVYLVRVTGGGIADILKVVIRPRR